MITRSLRWVDVDPGRHAFDREHVTAVVASVMPTAELSDPGRNEQTRRLEDRVTRTLLASEGSWIAGWRWAASEPGCGGIVRSYCCAAHSLRGSPDAMRDVIVGAVADFRARLEDLAEIFRTWADECAGLDDGEAASRAATRLLPIVLEWTGSEDAWYATYARIVAWALESRGLDEGRVLLLVEEAVGGRFRSWITPSDEVAATVSEKVGCLVETESREGAPVVNALERWWARRKSTRWNDDRYHEPEPVQVDAHRAFIERFDRARDSQRADRMIAALEQARMDARSDSPLSFEMMRAWQGLVLGTDVDFRDTDAFAHGGAERYGWDRATRGRFEKCVVDAEYPGVHPVARAARLYLDVCFIHPFPDGNARAARLALDFVLTRHSLALHAAEPVFLVARRACDPYASSSFLHVVDFLAGPKEDV